MHTAKHGETTFTYNSDFSGGIRITTKKNSLTIPSSNLFDFMAQVIKEARIRNIEEQSTADIIGTDVPWHVDDGSEGRE